MTQKTINLFLNRIYSKGPKQNNITKKIDVYHIDVIWSCDLLHMKDDGPENKRSYRPVSFMTDTFSKYGRTIPLTQRNSQTKANSCELVSITSKRNPT